jgi:hypothetical protein
MGCDKPRCDISPTLSRTLLCNRDIVIEALRYAREIWKVDMNSPSFEFRISSNPYMVQDEIEACRKVGIVVFASASNDAVKKPRTDSGDDDGMLCIHSANGAGNASLFNHSSVPRTENVSFFEDCVEFCWPMSKIDYDNQCGQKYLSGTSNRTAVAVSVALSMINPIRKAFPTHHWNTKPRSPEGVRRTFHERAHDRGGYN